MVVVLPAPLAPISANAHPSGTSKLKPRSASYRPNVFHKSVARIICGSPPWAFRASSTGSQSPRAIHSIPVQRASLPRQAVRPPVVEVAFCPPLAPGEALPPPFQFPDVLQATALGSDTERFY